jgi:hypothetical protein
MIQIDCSKTQTGQKKNPNISECLTAQQSTEYYNVAVAASLAVAVLPAVVRILQTCESLVGKSRVSLKYLFQTEIPTKLNTKRHTCKPKIYNNNT